MTTTARLTEDDLYRTSTQYRLWSFAPDQLAAQRRKTHELALARAHQYAQQHDGAGDGHVEYLTEQEELRLVRRYCELIASTSDHLRYASNVKTTAIQYLKRFYLSNSCMTYPPKEIYKTVLFMATKTEAIHITAPKFAASISADPDTILAPEYKIMQALRFTLDIRQPLRGLKGTLIELLNMASGRVGVVDGIDEKSGEEVKDALLALKRPLSKCRTAWKQPSGSLQVEQLVDRIEAANATARKILEGAASITDAYFLYTPSQILLAAMLIADEPLTSFYLESKLPATLPTRSKILATIQSCADLLATFDSSASMTKAERDALDKKLDLCRDPTTEDLVKSHAAIKRGGAEEGKIDEQEMKRRKMAREKSNQEMSDLFGPSLSTKTNGNG